MKELSEKETEYLAELLKRAIHNGQLGLRVASPFEGEGKPWEAFGFDFNDRHDGNSSTAWNCDVEISETENEKPEVGIYVDDQTLCFLVGIKPEEADKATENRE